VVTFNMDEYVGLEKDHQQSYHHYMWHNFFKYVDIRPENVNILDGTTGNVEAECRRYEEKIAAVGGIELFLGGELPFFFFFFFPSFVSFFIISFFFFLLSSSFVCFCNLVSFSLILLHYLMFV